MSYWQLFYHIIWATHRRQPWLTPDVETIIYRIIRAKAQDLEGTVFALNGTTDHVHLVVAIPPKIAVATFIGQVKGVSSALFNKEHPHDERFVWQSEYGAFSFDKKRLPNVIAYVERQKEHHRNNNLIPVLERCDSNTGFPIRETAEVYGIEDADWFSEMQLL